MKRIVREVDVVVVKVPDVEEKVFVNTNIVEIQKVMFGLVPKGTIITAETRKYEMTPESFVKYATQI